MMVSQRSSVFRDLLVACLLAASKTFGYDIPLEKADPPLMKPREYVFKS